MSQKKLSPTDKLPDTSKWIPRKDAVETLQGAFLKRCKSIEKRIANRAQDERETNINNFDSGAGIEDIIREELTQLLPDRYSINAGVINDRTGRTAEDFEIIITNDIWFTSLKAGATEKSRRYHFPIEAVYGIIEVKQTLTYTTLDDAMKKLVTCHRLYRPSTPSNRATENVTVGLPSDTSVRFNPLFSTIFATRLDPNISMNDILQRFTKISKSLKREEFVRSICVLGEGTINWYAIENQQLSKIALFIDDLKKPLMTSSEGIDETGSAFYLFAALLLTHLYRSILSPEDIAQIYGLASTSVRQVNPPDIFE